MSSCGTGCSIHFTFYRYANYMYIVSMAYYYNNSQNLLCSSPTNLKLWRLFFTSGKMNLTDILS